MGPNDYEIVNRVIGLNYNLTEVAGQLGMGRKTISTHLKRALGKLGDYWELGKRWEGVTRRRKAYVHRGFDPSELNFLQPLVGEAEVLGMQQALTHVKVTDEVVAYVVDIVRRTRSHPSVSLGASPRASIGLLVAARAHALWEGRDFVIPDDVKTLVLPTLRHRITPTARADIEGLATAKILSDLLERIPAPR